MKNNHSIIINCIHLIISRHCFPDGTIDKKNMFSILAERVGKVVVENKGALVRELRKEGIIIDESPNQFKIKVKVLED